MPITFYFRIVCSHVKVFFCSPKRLVTCWDALLNYGTLEKFMVYRPTNLYGVSNPPVSCWYFQIIYEFSLEFRLAICRVEHVFENIESFM